MGVSARRRWRWASPPTPPGWWATPPSSPTRRRPGSTWASSSSSTSPRVLSTRWRCSSSWWDFLLLEKKTSWQNEYFYDLTCCHIYFSAIAFQFCHLFYVFFYFDKFFNTAPILRIFVWIFWSKNMLFQFFWPSIGGFYQLTTLLLRVLFRLKFCSI